MSKIENLLEQTLKAYREIEDLEKDIKVYYNEAKEAFEELDEEDKEYERDYLECIRSYAE